MIAWPFEALVTVIERGLVPDWKPEFDEIRRSPWGSLARRVERYMANREPDTDGAGNLFALAIKHARKKQDDEDRANVAERVGQAIASSGLSSAEFAELVGTSASRLSTYRIGKVMPSAAMLLCIERTARQFP